MALLCSRLRDRDAGNSGTLTDRHYVLQDASWNVTAIIDSDGVCLERYAYVSYGIPTVLTDSFGSSLCTTHNWEHYLSGHRLLDETHLYDMRIRQYSAATASFIGRDPSDVPDTHNLLEYVSSNPLIFVDPLGLFEVTLPLIGTLPTVTGVCGHVSITASASVTSIVSIDLGILPFGFGESVVLKALKALGLEAGILKEMNNSLPKPLFTASKRLECDNESKCCIVYSQTLNVTAFVSLTATGTVTATISLSLLKRKISTTFVATATARVTSRLTLALGICVGRECRCPPALPHQTLQLVLGTEDRPLQIPLLLHVGDISLGQPAGK